MKKPITEKFVIERIKEYLAPSWTVVTEKDLMKNIAFVNENKENLLIGK